MKKSTNFQLTFTKTYFICKTIRVTSYYFFFSASKTELKFILKSLLRFGSKPLDNKKRYPDEEEYTTTLEIFKVEGTSLQKALRLFYNKIFIRRYKTRERTLYNTPIV